MSSVDERLGVDGREEVDRHGDRGDAGDHEDDVEEVLHAWGQIAALSQGEDAGGEERHRHEQHGMGWVPTRIDEHLVQLLDLVALTAAGGVGDASDEAGDAAEHQARPGESSETASFAGMRAALPSIVAMGTPLGCATRSRQTAPHGGRDAAVPALHVLRENPHAARGRPGQPSRGGPLGRTRTRIRRRQHGEQR